MPAEENNDKHCKKSQISESEVHSGDFYGTFHRWHVFRYRNKRLYSEIILVLDNRVLVLCFNIFPDNVDFTDFFNIPCRKISLCQVARQQNVQHLTILLGEKYCLNSRTFHNSAHCCSHLLFHGRFGKHWRTIFPPLDSILSHVFLWSFIGIVLRKYHT